MEKDVRSDPGDVALARMAKIRNCRLGWGDSCVAPSVSLGGLMALEPSSVWFILLSCCHYIAFLLYNTPIRGVQRAKSLVQQT